MIKPKLINKIINKEFQTIKKILNSNFLENNKNFMLLCKSAIKSLKNGNKIIFYGNGGSAADAQHLAAELVVKYQKKRKAISAISLSTDTSILTASGNDFGFNTIFSRQIEAIGKSGDISVAITTSGNSQNLIEAAKKCKKKKILTFCFAGNKGGRLKKYIKYPIIIPSNKTSVTQTIEITIGQIFCEIIENNFSN